MTEPAPAPAPAPATAPAPAPELQRTRLFDFHVRHGAHLVPFNGWEMPLYYASVQEEHLAVRGSVGLFDVSHMGILTVEGEHAAALLSRRTTANAERILPGQCHYSFWLNSEGVILDDLLVTRIDDGRPPSRFLVVPNAGRAPHIFDLLQQHRRPDTSVARLNGAVAILAVQGPRSRALLESTFGWSLGGLKFYTSRAFSLAPGPDPAGHVGIHLPADLAQEALVCRTGYTGELGYELFVAGDQAAALAERIVAAGARPCGLAARDTLRLEKGYLLSGQDFDLDRSPFEAAQDRFVELDHAFVGREALEAQRTKGLERKLVGLAVETPGAIPRHGTPVLQDGRVVATATSGGLSFSLGYGIALAYLPLPLGAPGTALELELRGRRVPGKVVALPFLRAPRA
jgi:aminomethyltransferase